MSRGRHTTYLEIFRVFSVREVSQGIGSPVRDSRYVHLRIGRVNRPMKTHAQHSVCEIYTFMYIA